LFIHPTVFVLGEGGGREGKGRELSWLLVVLVMYA